jgi:hypothetical protein
LLKAKYATTLHSQNSNYGCFSVGWLRYHLYYLPLSKKWKNCNWFQIWQWFFFREKEPGWYWSAIFVYGSFGVWLVLLAFYGTYRIFNNAAHQ